MGKSLWLQRKLTLCRQKGAIVQLADSNASTHLSQCIPQGRQASVSSIQNVVVASQSGSIISCHHSSPSMCDILSTRHSHTGCPSMKPNVSIRYFSCDQQQCCFFASQHMVQIQFVSGVTSQSSILSFSFEIARQQKHDRVTCLAADTPSGQRLWT